MVHEDSKLDYIFLDKVAYYKALTQDIDSTAAGQKILVATMSVLPKIPEVERLIIAMTDAAKRGINVHFSYDAYNYLVNAQTKSIGPLLYRGNIPRHPRGIYRELQAMHKRLESAGVTVTISNQPRHRFRNPFSGRSHIKTAVIGNVVYIGGCNLTKSDDIDIMARIQNKTVAELVYKTMSEAFTARSVRESLEYVDRSFAASNHTSILIDAGVKKQSLIYDAALSFIDDANEWLLITCQFFPNSETATHLLAAHKRGVDVKIVYNHPSKHLGMQHKALQSAVRGREQLRMPKSMFAYELPKSQKFLHAKVIASEEGGIVGSHNYVQAGVQFGTAELALISKQPEFGKKLSTFIESMIAV